MSLRVAFDVDGVFADMEGALRALTEVSSGPPAVSAPEGESFEADVPPPAAPDTRRRAWRVARRTHNFWETLPELEPGALARLRAVSRDRRWHVVFLTQRPATLGDSAQLQTQRWLDRHGFTDPSVLVVPGARGQLARALHLDFVIDDVPSYCLDVKLESNAHTCLIWRNEDSMLPIGTRRLGITVFRSVGSCLDHLEASGPTRNRFPRLVESLKQRFGLTPRVRA